MSSSPNRSEIEAALDTIFDPCSISAGVPLGLRAMGVIGEIEISDDGAVTVELCLTSPGCVMGVALFEPEIIDTVGELTGVRSVSVRFGDALSWSEEKISPEGRRRLLEVRQKAAERVAFRTMQSNEAGGLR
jgi:metal-sulfur cluster biosynthetic enzyme